MSPVPGPDQVTVVVPTYRRPRSVARALGGLAAQEGAPPFVVVVVDNDAGPHDPLVLPVGLSGRVVAEPRPGSAAARNRGMAEATTSLVAFLDDDVIPGPGWLAALAAPVLAGQADLTGGRVVLDPEVARPRWLDPGLEGYLTALDLGPVPRPLTEAESLLTASLVTRSDLLRRSGGFRSDLGPRPGSQLVGDDVHLVRALRAAGGRAWWVPDAVVVHELPPSRLRPGWVLARAFQQGRSDWRVDRSRLRDRRFGGARVAGSWLAGQARRRRAEGCHLPVLFHAACDLSRTAGALSEALRPSPRRPAPEVPA